MKSSKQHNKEKKEKKDKKEKREKKEKKEKKDKQEMTADSDSRGKDRDIAGEPLSRKQAKLLKKLGKMSSEEVAAYRKAALMARKVIYRGRKVKARIIIVACISAPPSSKADIGCNFQLTKQQTHAVSFTRLPWAS